MAATDTAIRTFLIADVRGYTSFTAERGDEAAASLAARFASVTREAVETQGGAVVELRGDEALAVFDSARQAIRTAIDLQRRFVDETVSDPRIPLAVGIGLDAGEAVPVEDGFRGGALNLAARLCSLAGPAEVLASREVVHLARKVDGVRYVDRGGVTLKGLPDPVHVIRLRPEADDPAEDTAFRRALGPAAAQLAPAVPGMVRNPYKGLRPFEEADAANFFGREDLTDTLVRRLAETRFLAVVGPSGSGKSSVVRAGLIPALRGGALPGSDEWPIAEMVPGPRPLDELEAALLRVAVNPPSTLIDQLERDDRGLLRAVKRVLPADGPELVLFIDQFEEVFTLVEDEEARTHFLGSIEAAVRERNSRLRVVITLRADFYDRPLLYRGFAELLRSRVEAVVPLAPHEFERAIAEPARRVDVRLEEGLVTQMVAEVAEEPGALPLLQYSLTELFERREDHILTVGQYRAIGGVSGALGRRAEELYAQLEPPGKEAARQLFLRLVALGEGTEDTRRPVPRTELASIDVDQGAMASVIDAFGASRLLSFDRDARTGAPTVEVAHEALLTAWGRLRRWIDDAREDLRTERRLALAAREWLDADRDPSFLLTGSRLEQFEAWQQGSRISITPEEREFLEESLEARDRRRQEEEARQARERELERRSLRRARSLVAVLAAAALLASAITVFAFSQRERAEREGRIAEARELAAAAAANLEVDPERSILLALEAIERTRSVDGTVLPEAQEALHHAVIASRIELSVPGLGGLLDWSPEGVFATEGPEETGLIDIRDAATGHRARQWKGHDIDVNDVAFSPDGSMLATTGDDGKLKVWDPATGDLLSSFSGEGQVWGPSFSGDGSLVAAAWPDEGHVRIMDPSTGRVVQVIENVEGGPHDTALSPDGDHIAVAPFDLLEGFVFDVASGDLLFDLKDHVYPINGISWSPDGRWIATAANDSSARVWDATTGESELHLRGHTGILVSADWSPDSRRLVTAGIDGTAKVWEITPDGAQELMSLGAQGTRAGIAAAFSPDGSHVITGASDISAVKIWDVSLSGNAEWANMPTDLLAPVGVAFLPRGRVVAPIDRGSVAIWDVETGRRIQTLGPGHGSPDPVVQINASPDGELVATVRNFARIVDVWDASTGDLVFEVKAGFGVTGIDWSADGARLAIATFAGTSKIVDRSGKELTTLQEQDGFALWALALSPDGRLLATSAVPDRSALGAHLTVRDWRTGEVVREIPLGAPAEAVAFDPTGSFIATAGYTGVVDIWSVETGERVGRLAAHSGPVIEVAYSSDGSTIATSGDDGTVRLFDADSGNELLVLRGHDFTVTGISFSPDGRRLASASPDGLVRVWALDLDDLIRIARAELTRGLTEEECRQYLHGPCPSP